LEFGIWKKKTIEIEVQIVKRRKLKGLAERNSTDIEQEKE
jgi:hypothetical protein